MGHVTLAQQNVRQLIYYFFYQVCLAKVSVVMHFDAQRLTTKFAHIWVWHCLWTHFSNPAMQAQYHSYHSS